MNLLKTIIAILILATITIFASCEKEGPEGPTGPAGKDGVDGNANVSSSLTVSSWTYDDPSWVANLSIPAITQDIVNTGAVLAYIKTQDTFYQIPITFYQTSTYSTSVEVETKLGGVSIYWTDSDRTTPVNPGSQTFKIIVIASSDRIKKSGIDVSDYEQVISEFNL
ncbi:MAG: hypothetical protein RIC95_13925 [Vicingaceae bacterium]